MEKPPQETSKDLIFTPLPPLSWQDGEQEKSLKQVVDYVILEAENVIRWYLKKKAAKRLWAQWLRAFAIVFVTVAAAIPILSDALGSDARPAFAPSWAYVALALAGGIISLDKFFGFSSGWMRFLTTEMKVRNSLYEFQWDWELRRAEWRGNAPTQEQVRKALGRCRSFLTEVNALVAEEMNTWKQEFQAALKALEQAAEAQKEALKTRQKVMQTGAIQLTVTNGEQCDSGWTLEVDHETAGDYTGKTAALTAMAPGTYKLAVKGAIGGRDAQAETPCVVKPGGVENVAMTLS